MGEGRSPPGARGRDVNYTPETKKKLKIGRIKAEIRDLQDELRTMRPANMGPKAEEARRDVENQIRELKGALRETESYDALTPVPVGSANDFTDELKPVPVAAD